MLQFKTTEDHKPQEPENEESDNSEEAQHSEFESSAAINNFITNYLENSKFSFEDFVEKTCDHRKTWISSWQETCYNGGRTYKGKPPKSKLEQLINKYPRPENCTFICISQSKQSCMEPTEPKVQNSGQSSAKGPTVLYGFNVRYIKSMQVSFRRIKAHHRSLTGVGP